MPAVDGDAQRLAHGHQPSILVVDEGPERRDAQHLDRGCRFAYQLGQDWQVDRLSLAAAGWGGDDEIGAIRGKAADGFLLDWIKAAPPQVTHDLLDSGMEKLKRRHLH